MAPPRLFVRLLRLVAVVDVLAFARVKARGGSCWGVEEAAECERLLGERYPGK